MRKRKIILNLDWNNVITGENVEIRMYLDRLVGKLGMKDNVIFTGYVSERDLWAIIKSAKMICFPSLTEGFGFPILEGFVAKVPVITSKTSSLPEVAGKAAIFVDPYNVTDIYRAMDRLIKDAVLAKRMIFQSKHAYNKFDWKTSANEYLGLYYSIK